MLASTIDKAASAASRSGILILFLLVRVNMAMGSGNEWFI